MKPVFIFLILFFCSRLTFGQEVKPYITIVKTKNDKITGVLYKVDSNSVVIALRTSFKKINIDDIKSIKLRSPKKDHELITFLTYDPWSEDNYEQRPDKIKIRKWGEKDPSLGEEITGNVTVEVVNAVGNILAAPIHSINPSIANFKINGDIKKYNLQKQELNYYSIYYQSNPNTLAELQKIKEISKQFKP